LRKQGRGLVDGCEVVNVVADRIRAEFLRRIGLGDLLMPRDNAATIREGT